MIGSAASVSPMTKALENGVPKCPRSRLCRFVLTCSTTFDWVVSFMADSHTVTAPSRATYT